MTDRRVYYVLWDESTIWPRQADNRLVTSRIGRTRSFATYWEAWAFMLKEEGKRERERKTC